MALKAYSPRAAWPALCALLAVNLACGSDPCVALCEQGATCPEKSGYDDDVSCEQQCDDVRQAAEELACLESYDEYLACTRDATEDICAVEQGSADCLAETQSYLLCVGTIGAARAR